MSDANCVFLWTECYKVNVAILDQQHQELFDVVNELEQALRVGQGHAAIDKILDRLLTYVRLHFAAEESLMELHHFPGLPTHQMQHEIFRKELLTFVESHRGGRSGVPVKLLLFLHNWFKDHLLTTDKLYSKFLNERGVR